MYLEIYFDTLTVVVLRYYAFILCFLVFFSYLCVSWRPKRNLPPGPLGLPLVGYLPFLEREHFRTLDNLRKKYGNVFSLYIGRNYVVILGDYAAVIEAYSKSATLDRPEGIFRFQRGGFGFAGFNGANWVKQRKTATRKMKDFGLCTDVWEQLVEDEVSNILEVTASTNGAPFDIGKYLSRAITNTISSLVLGKRVASEPQTDMLISALQASMEFFSQAAIVNSFPLLCNILANLRIGNYHKLISLMAYLNTFVRKEIEIIKNADSKGTDFVSSYLEDIKDKRNEKDTDFNESSLTGNAQALFVGASDTIQTSMMWLLLAMTAYPNVQRNVHHELDSVLGKDQKASWKERFKLPYTYAAIMEAQRWKTISPLSTARIASEDFKLCGYDVPKGSLININIWALHNDTRYWEDPERFVPERFLLNEGKEVNLKMKNYLPFSYGKRRCPGESVAMMEIFLFFTAIMQQYEIQLPKGGKPNLDAVFGLTYTPVVQELCFVRR